MATFSWASAADVGLGLVQGFAQGQAASATAKANNAIREANNSVARSNSMLARTIMNINNKRIMQSAGKNVGLLTQAAGALQDTQTRTGFEASVAQSEALGRASSAAAAMGASAGNLGMLVSVQEMAQARANEYRKVDNRRARDNQMVQLNSVMGDAIRSLDNSPLHVQQDYTQDTAPGMLGFLFNNLTSKVGSMQTLLGSLVGDPEQQTPGLTRGGASTITAPVYQGSVKGTDIAPFPSTGRVWEGRVTATPIAPMTTRLN